MEYSSLVQISVMYVKLGGAVYLLLTVYWLSGLKHGLLTRKFTKSQTL